MDALGRLAELSPPGTPPQSVRILRPPPEPPPPGPSPSGGDNPVGEGGGGRGSVTRLRPRRPARARLVRHEPDGPEERRLGRRVQRARRAAGLSIDDLAAHTRIRAAYLYAIEAGALSALPPPPYGRAFLREYASAVGVDPTPLLEAYDRRFSPPESLPHLPAPPRRPGRQWRVAWMSSVGLLVLLIASGVIGYRPSPPPSPLPQITPQRTEPPPPPPSPTLLPAVVTLTVSVADEPCWVRIAADGQVVAEGTLRPGESRTASGREVSVVLGNAGAARVVVDGRDLGVPGRRGQVWRAVFRPPS